MKHTNKLFSLIISLSSFAWAASNPMIIAHRGGKADWPENTLFAFKQAKKLGVDAIQLDVQVTKDGVPVVYEPQDLSKWTNGEGAVGDKTWSQVQKLNAAWNFEREGVFPYRDQNLRIPSLYQVLREVPETTVIIDMADFVSTGTLVKALIQDIPEKEWYRVVFNSSNPAHLVALKAQKPSAQLFEARDKTRRRLLEANATSMCKTPATEKWVGFELKRKMTVMETYAKDKAKTELILPMWTPNSVACTRQYSPRGKIVAFGINSKDELQKAENLKVDAVYTDSPSTLIE